MGGLATFIQMMFTPDMVGKLKMVVPFTDLVIDATQKVGFLL
tara:strand:+ start:1241 stop:1366 length:126 start_codon:yes stop_codon:yes gene_type:complete